MPKESLPISEKIKQKIKNLLKNRPKKKPKPPKFEVGDPNLLMEGEQRGKFYFQKGKEFRSYYDTPIFVKFAQLTIILLTAAFVVTSLTNLSLDAQIQAKEEILSQKVSELSTVKAPLEDLDYLSRKIDVLKEYESSSQDIAPYLELFLGSTNAFNFKNFEVSSTSASFSGTTKSPLTFSFIAKEYLQSGLVENIALQSASLNKREQVYELSFEVKLK